jgi:hypothetical protein
MDTVAELFSRNILGMAHTDEELRKIVERCAKRDASSRSKRKRKSRSAKRKPQSESEKPRQLNLEQAIKAGD